MNYKQRLALLMALDSMMIVFIVFIAFWIAYPYSLHVYDRTDMIVMAVALLIFHHILQLFINYIIKFGPMRVSVK